MDRNKPWIDKTINLGSVLVVLGLAVDIGVNLQRLKHLEQGQRDMATKLERMDDENTKAHLQITATVASTAKLLDSHMRNP